MSGVAVTRPGDGPGRLGELLEAAGASVVHWPCIRFDAPNDPAPLADAARRLDDYDWLVLTSPRAARYWLESTDGTATRRPPRLRVAAAGPATSAVLEEAGWTVQLLPEVYSARGLIDAFETAGDRAGNGPGAVPDARVLLPCSDRAADDLPDGLRRLGATVDRVEAYRTVPTPPDPDDVLQAARSGRVRVVTFTSPSTVEGFLSELRGTARAVVCGRLAAAAIGSTTAAALSRARWPGSVAAEATLEALAEVAIATAAEAAEDAAPARGRGRDGSR